MADKMNPQQFREFMHLRAVAADQQGRAKYGNIPTEVDGIKFQSRKEAHYYGQCKILQRSKQIESFEMQVSFGLDVNGVHICDYRADFVLHYRDGRREVIDVKSKATAEIPLYRIKKALMKAIYNIEIIEK